MQEMTDLCMVSYLVIWLVGCTAGLQMDLLMVGWIDGCMNRWMDGWIILDRWMDRYIEE